jgi:hypothetical protein
MHFRVGRPSPALFVALLALFFSLTGDPFAKGSGQVTGFNIKTIVSGTASLTPSSERHEIGVCPSGWAAISGGYVLGSSLNSISVTELAPQDDSHKWQLNFFDPPTILGGADGTVDAAVQCMHLDFSH